MSFWRSSFRAQHVSSIRDRRTSHFRFPIIVFLCLASCHHDPRVESFERSIGHLSQAELTRQFGYPQRLKQLKTGGEVWEYEFLSGNSRCVGYRVYFDEDLLSRRWEPAVCR